MSTSNNGVHILIFPYPAQGHMIPLLDLTHQLSLRGLTITLLITPKNLPILNPLLTVNPSIQTLVFPLPPDHSIPSGVENIRDLGNQGNIAMIRALSKLHHPIIQWFNSHGNPPIALIADFFLGWTHDLAQQLGIPWICFSVLTPFTTAISENLWASPESVKPGNAVNFQDLPRAPSFTWEQIPSLFRRYRESPEFGKDSSYELIRTSMLVSGLGWASVFNTFEALDFEFLDYLSKKLGHQRVYSVGPLNVIDGSEKLRVGGENDGVMSWLDECGDDGSVLYVCFGSQKFLKKAQMEALATGLERSGVRFVWAVKSMTAQQVADGYGSVPDGFEGRVSGRGFLVKGWAPQTSILSHRAVGGFLSHCGWNSVLEAVSAGVMVLGWPMEAEQFVNAKLLVEYKNCAIRVCEGGDTVPDSDELARNIRESMHGNAMERVRAKELREKALEAIKEGGSSIRDLDGLVQELAQLKLKNNV